MHVENIPAHVAVIMDGNGRWAKARGLLRTEGHREGLKTAKLVVAAAQDAGVGYLSLYVFSTENWKRTRDEVGFLMALISSHLGAELDFYRKRKIRVLHSGAKTGLPADVVRELERVERDTSAFGDMTVNLAINYGGRDEILRAISRLALSGQDLSKISEKDFSGFLDQPSMPDPDLVIRTGGDLRLSNFLPWQSAYSELVFSPKLWPDFTGDDFRTALAEYSKRERRFGGTK